MCADEGWAKQDPVLRHFAAAAAHISWRIQLWASSVKIHVQVGQSHGTLKISFLKKKNVLHVLGIGTKFTALRSKNINVVFCFLFSFWIFLFQFERGGNDLVLLCLEFTLSCPPKKQTGLTKLLFNCIDVCHQIFLGNRMKTVDYWLVLLNYFDCYN